MPLRPLSVVVAQHMESVGTRAFTRREVGAMFGDLCDVQIEHVGTSYDQRVAGPLATATGRLLGWFIVVRGRSAA